MSKQTKNSAQYVSEDLKIVENKIESILLDARDVKDAVLTKKVEGIKSSIVETREYIATRTGKKTG